MSSVNQEQLTDEQVAEILAKSNGPFVLVELVRLGRIDAERAVTAIEKADKDPWWKKAGYALLSAFTSP